MASVTVDEIRFNAFGIAEIKMMKTADDGTQQPHRTTLEPGTDFNNQFAAVNGHLQQMGYPALTGQQLAQVRTIVAQRQTPAVITAFQNMKNTQRSPRG